MHTKISEAITTRLYQQAFDNSILPHIVFNVATMKVMIANGAAAQLLGYSQKLLLTKSKSEIFNETDTHFRKMGRQLATGGNTSGFTTMIKKNGKHFFCHVTISIFANEAGQQEAVATICDMTRSLNRQKLIDKENKKIVTDNIIKDGLENKENFNLIFNSSSDVLYDMDLVSNEVIVSDGFETEFGYKTKPHMTAVDLWFDHIHPEDRDALIKDYHRVVGSGDIEWKYPYRFLKADNTVADILGSSIVLRKLDGAAYRLIGSMQDISKQKVLEGQLDTEIRLKESQIEQASEEAKEALRSELGKELHDNVNQLLGASKLYLDMAKHGGQNSQMYLGRSSEYTLTAIEEIRKLSKGLTTDNIKELGLDHVITRMAADIMQFHPVKISCAVNDLKDIKEAHQKFKLNIFRIVQEQLNNIIKHAKASLVFIDLILKPKTITLSIRDNGIGFDTSKKQKGIGLENIRSRAVTYNGEALFVAAPSEGCSLTVIFPITAREAKLALT
jgi:two-component system sensor histidine kinase UhpB